MSVQRWPVIVCDGCRERRIAPVYLAPIGLGEDSAQLRDIGARSGWTRQGRLDLCPACSGAHVEEDRRCACGLAYTTTRLQDAQRCRRCEGDLPPARTEDDVWRDELRAVAGLR